jgi:hypothetical protein
MPPIRSVAAAPSSRAGAPEPSRGSKSSPSSIRHGERLRPVARAVAPFATPYFLFVAYTVNGATYELKPWSSGECTRVTVAPGAVHTWVLRFAKNEGGSIRVVRRPEERRRALQR